MQAPTEMQHSNNMDVTSCITYLERERPAAAGLPYVLLPRARLMGLGASRGELREKTVPRPGLAASPTG